MIYASYQVVVGAEKQERERDVYTYGHVFISLGLHRVYVHGVGRLPWGESSVFLERGNE